MITRSSTSSRHRAAARAVALGCLLTVVAACDAGTPTTSGQAGAAGSGSSGDAVRIGFLYDVHAANVWTMNRCDGVDVELINFKQFAEVQRAFQSGQIDFAAMGYQNLAQLIEADFTDFKAVSGVYTGGEHLTIRSGADIGSWAELAGKKVGIPPNSFVEMLFRSAAEENGLDVADVEIVPFPGGGPPLLAALEKGDIDAMVSWEPNSANAAVAGYGEYSPFGDIQDGEIGKATSVMYVTNSFLEERKDDAAAAISCLADRTEELNNDHDQWLEALTTTTGLDAEVAEKAITTGEMDVSLYQDSAEKIIQQFAEAGVLQDVSDQVDDYFDYSILEEVTGKSAEEVGQS